MPNRREIAKKRILNALDKSQMRITPLARKAGVTPTVFTRFLNEPDYPSTPKEANIAAIEAVAGIKFTGYTAEQSSITDIQTKETAAVFNAGKIPILNYTQAHQSDLAGIASQTIGYVDTPSSLINYVDLYAVYIIDDSMSPELDAGDIRIISPHMPYVPGDTVLIAYKGANDEKVQSSIKKYVEVQEAQDGSGLVIFKQHNPNIELVLKLDDILLSHKLLTYKEVLGM